MTELSEDQLEQWLDMYDSLVRMKYDPEESRRRIASLMDGNHKAASQVQEEYRERYCRKIIRLKDPSVLRGFKHIQTWYAGSDFDAAWCWPAYRNELRKKGWSPEVIENIHKASEKMVAHLPSPRSDTFNARGLVVGYVQSGKTANYSAVIAKAVDAGYRFAIILAGMTNSLRSQTQRRLESELVRPNKKRVEAFTSESADFHKPINHPDFYLNPSRETVMLAVVKKNTHVLDRLIDFLEEATPSTLAKCPVLVIDDEADQASINTRQKATERSAINRKLVRLLDLMPCVAYCGYTATPFANIFIDPSLPEGLYPRHFMFSLDKPKRYFGATVVFGREALELDQEEPFDGLDVVRSVPPGDATKLKPPSRNSRDSFEPEMADSLATAIDYFLLASAERLARGQGSHCSMLVHTTLYTITHERLAEVIAAHLHDRRDRIADNAPALRESLRALWQRERERVTTEDVRKAFPEVEGLRLERQSFDSVFGELNEVLERVEPVIDNAQNEGLDYRTEEGEPSKIVIAIGGNTLSRGLTLEGLLVSYFIRPASAYDTLLQMGRWFGYRIGYEDLPRVWMTDELQSDFYHLATIEEEVRHDIARYEATGRTPDDFGVRIRTHPKLAVTSRLKMQKVQITSASFSNSHVQTFMFRHEDAGWLLHNLQLTREMLSRLRKDHKIDGDGSERTLIYNVEPEEVLDFLENYKVVAEHAELERGLVTNYIRHELAVGGLRRWNVGVFGTSGGRSTATVDLGFSKQTACIMRSRYQQTEPANIKALTSPKDRLADLNVNDGRYPSSEVVAELRNKYAPDHGLLMIYPIDKNSEPASDDSKVRHQLEAAEHIVGIGLMFPSSKRDQREYVANSLRAVYDGTALDEELPEETDVNEILKAQDQDEPEMEEQDG